MDDQHHASAQLGLKSEPQLPVFAPSLPPKHREGGDGAVFGVEDDQGDKDAAHAPEKNNRKQWNGRKHASAVGFINF